MSHNGLTGLTKRYVLLLNSHNVRIDMKRAKSRYAPAERAAPATVDRQGAACRQDEALSHFMEAIPSALVLLNQSRQVVWANWKFIETIGQSWDKIKGRRPGEVLNCIRAHEAGEGCGTTEFCESCGAVDAILESQKGNQAIRECRILTGETRAFELSVCATPFRLDEEEFTILVLLDISAYKQRELLERTFLHDLSNTVCGLLTACELFRSRKDSDAADLNRLVEMMLHFTERIADEIESQRQLLAAERGDLPVNSELVSSMQLIEQTREDFSAFEIAHNKDIVIDPLSEEISFVTDSILLQRVLGNMVINALEATEPGGKISVLCVKETDVDALRFSIHNSGELEKEVRHQIFQRSFSTKGPGRGIGTYSMKLIGERFLGGKVWFSSSAKEGTTFSIQLPLNANQALFNQ
jgi:signal transduction histidine kinase